MVSHKRTQGTVLCVLQNLFQTTASTGIIQYFRCFVKNTKTPRPTEPPRRFHKHGKLYFYAPIGMYPPSASFRLSPSGTRMWDAVILRITEGEWARREDNQRAMSLNHRDVALIYSPSGMRGGGRKCGRGSGWAREANGNEISSIAYQIKPNCRQSTHTSPPRRAKSRQRRVCNPRLRGM